MSLSYNKIHDLLPDKEIRISIKLKQKYVVFLQDKKSPEYSSLSGNVEEAVSLFRLAIYLFFVCFLLQIAFPSCFFSLKTNCLSQERTLQPHPHRNILQVFCYWCQIIFGSRINQLIKTGLAVFLEFTIFLAPRYWRFCCCFFKTAVGKLILFNLFFRWWKYFHMTIYT